MNRWDIINLLIRKNNYKSYLEIGYFKGWSFDQVKGVELKVAVDPNPCKTDEQVKLAYTQHESNFFLGKSEIVVKSTSDDYFIHLDSMGHRARQYDLIFIDGLHESSQVEKDIKNSLNHLSPGGTIVLHDCNPPTLVHATTGDAAGNWNGDVYKAWIKFRFRYPEYESYTIDTDWGCGVIETPPDLKSVYIDGLYGGEDYNKYINDWDLFDKNRKGLLNLVSIEEFLKTKHG